MSAWLPVRGITPLSTISVCLGLDSILIGEDLVFGRALFELLCLLEGIDPGDGRPTVAVPLLVSAPDSSSEEGGA